MVKIIVSNDCNTICRSRGGSSRPSSIRRKIICLDSIVTYFRLNPNKLVDDLTQHFLCCLFVSILNSWTPDTIVYDYRKGQVFPFRIGTRREYWKLMCHLKPPRLDWTKVKVKLMKWLWIYLQYRISKWIYLQYCFDLLGTIKGLVLVLYLSLMMNWKYDHVTAKAVD